MSLLLLVATALVGFVAGKHLDGSTKDGFTGMVLALAAFIPVGTILYYAFGGETKTYAVTASSMVTTIILTVVAIVVVKKFRDPWTWINPEEQREHQSQSR